MNYGQRARLHGRYGKLQNRLVAFYAGKTVLVTGHTGFKGAWLSLWLKMLGARVVGYSLNPPTQPSLFDETGLAEDVFHNVGDIRDLDSIQAVFQRYQPEVVFHLAAQPLVRLSYEQPVETFSTNVMGTVNLLEALKSAVSVKCCVCITSDKCYENREWPYAYRENDAMGGYDPYSASKGAAELVIASYGRSFFSDGNEKALPALASARAGNVIGGGDWALDRIFPDAVKALASKQAVPVRNPLAIRPWQHVLEPLSGYLWLALKLVEDRQRFGGAWNFGPLANGAVNVREMVEKIISVWGEGNINDLSSGQKKEPHEANFLRLDCSKAIGMLRWLPVLSVEEAVRFSAEWYKNFYKTNGNNVREFSESQILSYSDMAAKLDVEWAQI
jgi:CDP-glucose 4,6-dehydratase